eukprot:3071551-Prymnesium_polylepis.1
MECVYNDVNLDVMLRPVGAPMVGEVEDAMLTLASALPLAKTERAFAEGFSQPPPAPTALVGDK